MRYIDEYRDGRIARALVARIRRRATRRWVMMEICGGQTPTLMRHGSDELTAGRPGQAREEDHPRCLGAVSREYRQILQPPTLVIRQRVDRQIIASVDFRQNQRGCRATDRHRVQEIDPTVTKPDEERVARPARAGRP